MELTALYLVADPKIEPKARDEILRKAAKSRVSAREVRRIIAQHRPKLDEGKSDADKATQADVAAALRTLISCALRGSEVDVSAVGATLLADFFTDLARAARDGDPVKLAVDRAEARSRINASRPLH